MGVFHDATITPSKPELIAAWAPSQPWCPGDAAPIQVIGAYRIDDPEGRVGMEGHIVSRGETVLHVPLTYREAPLDDPAAVLVGETEHSALGRRWVYDGLSDPRFVMMIAAVAMTGQGEALGMVQYDGTWHIAPAAVRLAGGGWTGPRVSVDDLALADDAGSTVRFRNDGFELAVHRLPLAGGQPEMGLTARWHGAAAPVVVAEVRSLS